MGTDGLTSRQDAAFNREVVPDSDTHVDPGEEFERRLVTGGELLRQGRTADARQAFAAALELKPDDAKALGLLGLVCFRMGDFKGALPVYQKLVSIHRNDASHWLNLGLVHLKLNDAASAIVELERSRELDPSQSRAVSYLGLAYARCGKYAQAYLAFLQAGDGELAREMEQYLSQEERARLQAAVPQATQPALSTGHSAARSRADTAPVARPPATPRAATVSGAQQRPATRPRRNTGAPSARVESRQEGAGVISRAVEQALPSTAAAAGAARVAVGHVPPTPLSEFVTSRLIRPQDGDHTFETSAGGVLVVRVRGRIYTRTEGVSATGGELTYEIASRHVRGSSTGEGFSGKGGRMFVVHGAGHMVAAPLGEHFSVVALDDDILYLREELVFAFEDQLRWENGHVPGSQATLRMVQFRGRGEVAFRSKRPLLAIKLAPERVLYIDAHALAGWIGRVVPRAVSPAAGSEVAGMHVECTGEGVVLVQEAEGTPDEWSRAAVPGMRMGGSARASEKA